MIAQPDRRRLGPDGAAAWRNILDALDTRSAAQIELPPLETPEQRAARIKQNSIRRDEKRARDVRDVLHYLAYMSSPELYAKQGIEEPKRGADIWQRMLAMEPGYRGLQALMDGLLDGINKHPEFYLAQKQNTESRVGHHLRTQPNSTLTRIAATFGPAMQEVSAAYRAGLVENYAEAASAPKRANCEGRDAVALIRHALSAGIK